MIAPAVGPGAETAGEGRVQGGTAMPHTDRNLPDDWVVAAKCGAALKALGDRGREALLAHVREQGAAADLARQLLFDVSSLALEPVTVAS